MKYKVIAMLLALLTAVMCCSCAPEADDSGTDAVSSADTQTTRPSVPASPVTFEMTDSLSEQDAKVNGSDLSEDSPLNIYGFPLSDYPYFIYVEKGSRSISIYTKDANGYTPLRSAAGPPPRAAPTR